MLLYVNCLPGEKFLLNCLIVVLNVDVLSQTLTDLYLNVAELSIGSS